VRRALSLAIGTLLASGVGSVYLRQAPDAVTVDDAVTAFRSASGPPVDGGSATGTSGADPSSDAATIVPSTAADGEAAPAAGSAPTTSAAPAPGRAADGGRTGAAGSAPATPAVTVESRQPSPPPEPRDADIEEGVYTFATEGYEATSALGGARHDYPRETPVTMRRSACGWTQRWQPLAERWDESELCRTDAGMDVRRFTTYHEFFQKTQQQQFECPPGSAVHQRDAQPGATWSWHCAAGASAIDTVVTVLGPEAVVVEGQEVAATKVHYESTMTGGNRGTQKQDRWIRRDGLNLRIKTDIDAEADSPFGAVHYEEHYVITIASLTPRR
jgi:hypothetical protein